MNSDDLKAIAAKSDAAMKRLNYAEEQIQKALNDPHAAGNIVLTDALAHVIQELKSLRSDVTRVTEALSGGIDGEAF